MDTSNYSPLPVLYLDWDGVINFDGSRTQHRKKSGLGYQRRSSIRPVNEPYTGFPPQSYPQNWSAELLVKLSALPVEIAFLSTWKDDFSLLLRMTDWSLRNYRVLDWSFGTGNDLHAGKVQAILEDQRQERRPFIWADDSAHTYYTEELRQELASVPQLLLEPDEAIGLTLADYNEMVVFLNSLKHRS